MDEKKLLKVKKLANHRELLVPAILAFVLSSTILENFLPSVINQSWAVHIPLFLMIIAGVLAVFYIPTEINIFYFQRIRYVFVTLILICTYVGIHSVNLKLTNFHIVSSCVLLILLSAVLKKNDRIKTFSIFILLLLSIIVFYPGVSKIFTLTRSFGSGHRARSDILIGVSGHYINYAMRCMMAFFIASGLCLSSKTLIKKTIFAFIAITGFVGCVTAGSRGAIIALFAGFIFFLFVVTRKIYRQRIVRPKYAFICVMAAIFILPWNNIYQAFMIEGGMEKRGWLLLQGWEIFKDNMLIGIGWGGFYNVIQTSQHSNWARTFVELGFLGATAEIIVWYMFFRIAHKAKIISERIGNKELAILVISWTSIMLSFFIWQAGENIGLIAGTRLYYICFGVVSAAYLSAIIQANIQGENSNKK